MYGIYATIWGILMVNVTIYSIHGSYGLCFFENIGSDHQNKTGLNLETLRFNHQTVVFSII